MSLRKRGPGRPRLPRGEAKGAVLSVRLTSAERAAVDRAAEAAGYAPSEWARAALIRAASGATS